MTCYNCGGCVQTSTMNLCFSTFTVSGLPNTTAVVLEFESMADSSKRIAGGTTDGSGNLVIATIDMPDFVTGVQYKMTPDQTWTPDTTIRACGIIQFEMVTDKDGFVTGVPVTVEECD